MPTTKVLLLLLIMAPVQLAQTTADDQSKILQTVLQRLDKLEQENRALTEEVRSLRQQLSQTNPAAEQGQTTAAEISPPTEVKVPLDERVTVAERRIEEQAQTKVDSGQRLPITINGMLLFNTFLNSGTLNSSAQQQAYQDLLTGSSSAGATFEQTILGFQYDGPQIVTGGKVNAFLSLDFYGGASNSYYGGIRIRRAGISVDWKNRSFMVGQDKPLVSPRQPNSLAEVAHPPLSAAGNLWYWLPQARYEERHSFTDKSGFKAQVSILETSEAYAYLPEYYGKDLEPSRPAFEGRLAFWHKWDEDRQAEIAGGYHTSTSHMNGYSIPSRLFSVDWRLKPARWFEYSGTYFSGKNLAGIGGPAVSFSFVDPNTILPVHANGGWMQLSFPVTSKLSFNAYGGWQSGRDLDIRPGMLDSNREYAGNIIYHLGQNVLVGLEAAQERYYMLSGPRYIRNHYDLALGYSF